MSDAQLTHDQQRVVDLVHNLAHHVGQASEACIHAVALLDELDDPIGGVVFVPEHAFAQLRSLFDTHATSTGQLLDSLAEAGLAEGE